MKPLTRQLAGILISVALCAITAGCNEEIASSHATLAAAREDIEKGWIPPVLPPSTTQIHETHDLDTNTGHGTFAFGAADAATFKNRLTPLTPDQLAQPTAIPRERLQSKDYEFYRYADFYLAVDWPHQQGEFWLRYSH